MATITGDFPDKTFLPVCDALTEWRKVNGSWGPGKNIPMNARNFLYFNEMTAVAFNWTNRKSGGFSDWHFGPFNVKVTGVPTPVPIDQLIESTKIRTNNKPFLKKVKRGDIVVSPYRNITCNVRYSNGGRKLSEGPRTVRTYGTSALGGYGFSITSEKTRGSSQACYIGNPNAVIAGTFNIYTRTMSFTDNITAFEAGFDPSVFKKAMDSLHSSLDETAISGLVMSNLSEANSATVDMLTAIAEMPETLVSALNGCQTILKIFKESKKGEFRWLNKAKSVRIQRDRAIEAEQLRTLRETLGLRDAKAKLRAEREAQRRIKQLQADSVKQLAEISDAIASVWLNFRYNIMPNVYLIEDCVKAYETFGELYRRWVKTEVMTVKPPQFEGWTCQGDVNVTVRCFIKRKFKQTSDMSSILRNFSFNIFKTAYELIPLSFVLDWVVPIGDLLSSALGGNPSDYTEACTLSYKVENSQLIYTHSESGATATVTMKGYERRVINPYDYCRLVFLPNINATRQFDAVALAWSILRGNTLRNL